MSSLRMVTALKGPPLCPAYHRHLVNLRERGGICGRITKWHYPVDPKEMWLGLRPSQPLTCKGASPAFHFCG